MIYSVREVDWELCDHLALVEGPDMSRLEASETFRRLLDEYQPLREKAEQAFRSEFGWYDKPLKGLAQENYHERWRYELRKAGCWSFLEFLTTRGFTPVEHRDVSLPRCDETETDCLYTHPLAQDGRGVESCLDLTDPARAEAAGYASKVLADCCKPCQRRAAAMKKEGS